MKRLAVLLAAMLLTACQAASSLPAPAASSQNLPNASPIPLDAADDPGSTAAPLEVDSLAKVEDRSRYVLDVSYNYGLRRIQVQQTIDYLNQSEESLSTLLLAVEAGRLGAEFLVNRIAVDGAELSTATLEGDRLQLPLPAPLASGQRVRIELDYSLRLPDREGPLGYSSRQQNWADWYPFVPPYQSGEGWRLHPAAEVGEHLVYESADFLVRIRVEEGESILIAAPALAEDGDGYQQYTLENARRFAWSASPDYLRLEGERDGIPIQAYVFAEHEAAGQAAIATAEQSLALFSELFGDYPYASLTIVEGDFPDGMESDALFWLFNGYFEGYSGNPQNYLTTLTAHEIAHNWWFGQVGNDAANQPWLDEALCTISEMLYYKHSYPNLLAWWWRFRILDFAPTGAVDSTIYDHEGFAPYVQAVYFRGALFLEEVHAAVGDDAFIELLAAYTEAGAGRIMTSQDFLDLLEQETGLDLTPLLAQYFSASDD